MSNPLIAWQQLRAGNQSSTMQASDQPIAAVFRCSDSCVSNETVFGRGCGSLVDISTWGHTVDTSVLASLEYAVETLEVPLVVVLGHDDCPAMWAALQAWDQAELPDGAMRSTVEHALLSVVRRGAAADSVESVTTAHVAETGVGLMRRSPALTRRVDNGTCGIVCVTYSSAESRLRVHATVGAIDAATDSLVECV
ncbi:MAG: carbonic anhydrase [Mycobacterium sp.]